MSEPYTFTEEHAAGTQNGDDAEISWYELRLNGESIAVFNWDVEEKYMIGLVEILNKKYK